MARTFWFPLVALVGVGAGLGCSGVGDLTIAGSAGAGGSTSSSSGSSGSTTGVPCDVAQALSVCVSCHSNPPIAGAVGSLVSYADLTAPAPPDPLSPPMPGATMAQQAVVRMQDTTRPMPPAGIPPLSATQIQAVQSWVAMGSPPGSCGTDAGPPDMTFTGPSVCTGTIQPFNGDGDSHMTPGEACIACHAKYAGGGGDEGPPIFTIAGTVFPTGHVPNDCVPNNADGTNLQNAQVVITDANNVTIPLSVNRAGNFFTQQAVAFPFHAKVVYNGKERPMLTAQTSGDCNSCHTDAGNHNAPGRIALPN